MRAAREFLRFGVPKGSEVLLWRMLPKIITMIPSIESLHSTIKLLRTLRGSIFYCDRCAQEMPRDDQTECLKKLRSSRF